MADEPTLEGIAQQLYAAEPDQFVARRTELVKKFRTGGDKELAGRIAALRKPTKSAHLLNVLAHDRPDLIAALAELAEELQRAQRALDGPRLRELTTTRRDLLRRLVAAVTELATEPPTPGIVEEVTSTLTAALADRQVATQLAAGLVVQPGEWSGFGLDVGPSLTLLPGGGDAKQRPGRRNAAQAQPPAEPAPERKPEAEPAPAPTAGSARRKTSPVAPARTASSAETSAQTAAAQRRAELDAAKNERLSARDSKLADRRTAELTAAAQELQKADAALASAQGAVDDAQTRVDELSDQLAAARETLDAAETDQATAQRTRREAYQSLQRVKRRQS